ncbi:hypothetical protein ACTA71_012305 [Dictyostelium dimigraforme]
MSLDLENPIYSRIYLDGLLGSEVSKICKQLGLKSTGVKPQLIKTILKFQNGDIKNKVAKTKSKSKSKSTTTINKKSNPTKTPKPSLKVSKSKATTTNKISKPTKTPKPKVKISKKRAVKTTATNTTTTATTTTTTTTTSNSTTPQVQSNVTSAPSEIVPPSSTTTPGVTIASGEVVLPPPSSTTTTTITTTPEVIGTASSSSEESSTTTTTTTEEKEFKHDGDPDNEVIALRMQREGCNSGELHASLIWNDIADLDLHVITPSGEHLYYGKKESKCGGWLDKDMNVTVGKDSENPIENIFWASAPSGKYKIYVNHFRCHILFSDPRFESPTRSVPFRVRLIKEGKTEWFQSSIEYGKNITCFEFELKGSGAVGSFVVLPPNSQALTFKELCENNKVSYSQGEGYYALKKKEEISEIKDMVLHNTKSDTFIIGHHDVCVALNQPTNKRLTLKPTDLPQDTRLFVQSTSHNRKIPADTHVLMRVSVKEALSFRQSSKYNFR